MYIAVLFTIAKTWKQPTFFFFRQIDKDVGHIYSGILLNHKKECNKSICSNMDGLRDYHPK